jgi:hypothetical protein
MPCRQPLLLRPRAAKVSWPFSLVFARTTTATLLDSTARAARGGLFAKRLERGRIEGLISPLSLEIIHSDAIWKLQVYQSYIITIRPTVTPI